QAAHRPVRIRRQGDVPQSSGGFCQRWDGQLYPLVWIRGIGQSLRLRVHRNRRLGRERSGERGCWIVLKQERKEDVFRGAYFLREYRVEFLVVGVGLEEQNIEDDRLGPRCVKIVHDVTEAVPRPGPATEGGETGLVDSHQTAVLVGLRRFTVPLET